MAGQAAAVLPLLVMAVQALLDKVTLVVVVLAVVVTHQAAAVLGQ
jgi:hypothetical protein